jgi:F420-dependent oxidoreductase-like protein
MEHSLPVPSLVVLVGPSSSGKSTWALEMFAPNEVVSSDQLRAMAGIDETDQRASAVAFEILDRIVSARLERGLTTVIDTTGLDRESRRRWVSLATTARIPTFAVVFHTDLDTCLERNETRERKRPRSVIRKQWRRLESSREEIAEDGFDGIIQPGPVSHASPAVARAASAERTTPSQAQGHTFGLMLSRFDWDGETSDLLADIAVRAERAGFRDIWFMDHLRQIPSVGRPWEDILEPYTALAFVAAHTSSIRLGCLVSEIDHRHPAMLAKSLATLDVLSGGRANCGLGVGWDRAEHEAYGLPFPDLADRYDMLEEAVGFLRSMWGKGAPEFEGEHYRGTGLAGYPRPLQSSIPILVGGSGEKRTLRLVARLADAANLFGTPEKVAHKVQVLRRHCAEEGRDPDTIEVTHLVNCFAASSSKELRARYKAASPPSTSFEEYMKRHNGGVTSDVAAWFRRYGDAGASHSIVYIPRPDLEGSIESFGEVISGMS